MSAMKLPENTMLRPLVLSSSLSRLFLTAFWLFSLGLSIVTKGAISVTIANALSSSEEESASSATECRLWIAPSAKDGDGTHASNGPSELGLFAGINYRENETLPIAEVLLPLVDMTESVYKDSSKYAHDILQKLEDVGIWSTVDDFVFPGNLKFEGNLSTPAYIPGLGVWTNYHSGISNVDWVSAAREGVGEEEEHFAKPGQPHLSRGAISSYQNIQMKATRDIPAGMELFANWGDHAYNNNDINDDDDDDDDDEDDYISNYKSKSNSNSNGQAITRKDHDDADKIVNHIVEFMNKFDTELGEKKQLREDIFNFILEKVLDAAADDRVRANALRSLIPDRLEELAEVQDTGTFLRRNPQYRQSQEWLKQHGLCVDRIASGISTIADAGRGAFARHDIEKGNAIMPVPVHPISHNQVMELFPVIGGDGNDDGSDGGYRLDRSGGSIGQQIAVNYCIGHPDSDLLLLPSGPMFSLVNHAPNYDSVNAELKWSDDNNLNWSGPLEFYDRTNPRYRHMAPKKLAEEDGRVTLMMMLVATRDIQAGEEIFLNYGDSWSEAWKQYEKDAALANTSKWPHKARDVSIDNYHDVVLPAGVQTACYIDKDYVPDGIPAITPDGKNKYSWARPMKEWVGRDLVLCKIVSVEEVVADGSGSSAPSYTVEILDDYVLSEYGDGEKKDGALALVLGVPHEAIILVDTAYTSDMFAPRAFRHYIGMDEEDFPQAWRK